MKTLVSVFAMMWALEAQQPAPDLQISANGRGVAELPKGWPLLVRGVITHSRRQVRPPAEAILRLAPPGMNWADSVRFAVTSAGGDERPWDIKLAGVPAEPALDLPGNAVVSLTWRLSGEATAALPAGAYRLTAEMEIKGSEGWNGKVRSLPVTVQVLDEPGRLSPRQEVEKAMLRMQDRLIDDQQDEALAIVDALLASQPTSVEGLCSRAELLENRGENAAAYVYALQAVKAFGGQNPALELPRRLQALQARTINWLLSEP